METKVNFNILPFGQLIANISIEKPEPIKEREAEVEFIITKTTNDPSKFIEIESTYLESVHIRNTIPN